MVELQRDLMNFQDFYYIFEDRAEFKITKVFLKLSYKLHKRTMF